MKACKPSAIQPQMFQFVDMDELVPKKHILRQLNEALDFSIVHDWVAPLYTERTGRPAADPERMIRLMLLSYLFNHSERELYQLLPMHAGYLWFCGLDFESVLRPDPSRPSLPDRTTLVKTRKLWRKHGIFEKLMKHIVNQCIAAGLVQSDVHASVDGTQVRANASIHSLKEITLAPVESIENYLARTARQDEQTDGVTRDSDDDSQPPAPPARKEQRLEDEATHEDFHGKTFSNKTHRSVTDPDARLYKKSSGQEAHLRYLVHHVTDVKSGVILSTQASIASGTAERETSLQQLSAIRFAHPQIRIRTLSADKAYGTTDYLQALFEQGIIPLVSLRNLALEDVPTWKRQTNNPEKQRKRLAKIREIQIRNKAKQIQLKGSYRHLQKLRTRCEHVFAESKVAHGLGRARSRGLDCMQEQALLTAIVQNLKRLCRFRRKRPQTGISACQKPQSVMTEVVSGLLITALFGRFPHFACRRNGYN
mgnify:CR=1 FL=1